MILIIAFFVWPVQERTPKQIKRLKKHARGDLTIAYVGDSVCIMCPDGQIAFKIANDPKNVIFIADDWTQTDVDNFTRSLQPECDVEISTPELAAYLMKHGKRSGEVWSLRLEAE
ncbi:MAG: hypothetical protein QNK37_28065 [Acidobacteriota bacterium]|nr:hypothetical protein [Acidobacteriota bacterium]